MFVEIGANVVKLFMKKCVLFKKQNERNDVSLLFISGWTEMRQINAKHGKKRQNEMYGHFKFKNEIC